MKITPLHHRRAWCSTETLRVVITQETLHFVRRKGSSKANCLNCCLQGHHHLCGGLLDLILLVHICEFSQVFLAKWTHHEQIEFLCILKHFLIRLHHNSFFVVFISLWSHFICRSLPNTCFNAVNTGMGHVGFVCVYCTVRKCSSLRSHAFRYSSTKSPRSCLGLECHLIEF